MTNAQIAQDLDFSARQVAKCAKRLSLGVRPPKPVKPPKPRVAEYSRRRDERLRTYGSVAVLRPKRGAFDSAAALDRLLEHWAS